MTKAEALTELTALCRDLLEDKSLVLTEDMTASDVDGWDSVEHFNIIAEAERRFKMRFQMREVSGVTNIGELAEIIAQRGTL